MKRKDLPLRWQNKLATYLHDQDNHQDELQVSDFSGKVCLDFEDGSQAIFNHVFLIDARELNELLVLTEHCGYHIFSRSGLKWHCEGST